MSDDELICAVESALKRTGCCQYDDIAVSVSHGWVELKGTIEWDYQKRTVLFAVKAVQGVTGITDHIALRFVPFTLHCDVAPPRNQPS